MSEPARPLIALAAISGIEGVALVGYAAFELIEAFRLGATGPADVSNVPAIILQIVLFALFGVGLLVVAPGWWGARRWARAPFLLAQLIALVVGVPLAQSSGGVERIVGAGIAVAALLGIVLVFTPAVTKAIDA